MTGQITAIATTAIAVAALVAAEVRARRVAAAVAKAVASLGFVALAGLRADLARPFDRWVVVALLLSLVGDVLLALPRALPAGLASFLLAHVGYLLAFASVRAPGEWPLPIAVVLALAAVGAAAWLWPHLGRLRPAVLAYVAVVTAMAWGALAMAPRAGWAVSAAGILFYASDFAVARDRFVVRRFASRAWGLPAYYAAQLLFALALGGPGAGRG